MKNLRFTVCLLLIAMYVFAYAGPDTKNKTKSKKELIARMAALNDKERMEFLGELSKERSDIQGNLIHQLGASDSKEMKSAAAFLLGMYRMDQSVYHLSKFITLENEHIVPNTKEPLWDRYPVVEALIRIGKPAVPEMLRNIRTSDDEKTRELSARVIRYVEGPEIGRIILEKALEKQDDTKQKSRLEEALTLVYFKPPVEAEQ